MNEHDSPNDTTRHARNTLMNRQEANDPMLHQNAKSIHDNNVLVAVAREIKDNMINWSATSMTISLISKSRIFYSHSGGDITGLHIVGDSKTVDGLVPSALGKCDADDQFFLIGRHTKHVRGENSIHGSGTLLAAYCFGPDCQVLATVFDVDSAFGAVMLYCVPRGTRGSNPPGNHMRLAVGFKLNVDDTTGKKTPVFTDDTHDDFVQQHLHLIEMLKQSPFHVPDTDLAHTKKRFLDWVSKQVEFAFESRTRGGNGACVSLVILAESLDARGHCRIRYNESFDDLVACGDTPGRQTSLRQEVRNYFVTPLTPAVGKANGKRSGKDVEILLLYPPTGFRVDLKEIDSNAQKSALDLARNRINAHSEPYSVVLPMRATKEDLDYSGARGSDRTLDKRVEDGETLDVPIDVYVFPEKDCSWNVKLHGTRVMTTEVACPKLVKAELPSEKGGQFRNNNANAFFVKPIIEAVAQSFVREDATLEEMEKAFESKIGFTPEVFFDAIFASWNRKELAVGGTTARRMALYLLGQGIAIVEQLANFVPSLCKRKLPSYHEDSLCSLRMVAVCRALLEAYDGGLKALCNKAKAGKLPQGQFKYNPMCHDITPPSAARHAAVQPATAPAPAAARPAAMRSAPAPAAAPAVALATQTTTLVAYDRDRAEVIPASKEYNERVLAKKREQALKRKAEAARETRARNTGSAKDNILKVWHNLTDETGPGFRGIFITKNAHPTVYAITLSLLNKDNVFEAYTSDRPTAASAAKKHEGIAIHQIYNRAKSPFFKLNAAEDAALAVLADYAMSLTFGTLRRPLNINAFPVDPQESPVNVQVLDGIGDGTQSRRVRARHTPSASSPFSNQGTSMRDGGLNL